MLVIQNHLRYYGAPVLVNDITVVNPTTNQPLTLDGILGTICWLEMHSLM